MEGSLVVVGTGIKFISHLTFESKSYIENSEKVLYLVNEPAIQEWIQKVNPNTESLEELYLKHPFRHQCYKEITEYILKLLRKKIQLCVVLYGHPTVFADPALDAVVQAKKEGFFAKILPGISSEDCLFSDLLIDPGTKGCQSFEATDFLVHQRKWDNSSYLILWQISMVGMLGHQARDFHKKIAVLLEHLLFHYSPTQKCILYQAAQYPMFEPSILEFRLSELININISRISTLVIFPKESARVDLNMLKKLEISIEDLTIK